MNINTFYTNVLELLNKIVNNGNVSSNEFENLKQRVTDIENKTNFKLINETVTTKTISSNIYYKWGEVTELNITFADISNDNIINEYMIEFISGATPTNLTLPTNLKYPEDFIIEANKIYQISIINNIVAFISIDNL